MERIYQRSIPFGVPTTTTTLFDSSERERGGEGTGDLCERENAV